MPHQYKNKYYELNKVIRFRIKNGLSFHLQTSKPDYWRALIERDIDGCTIEDVDDGLVVK